jgi:ankyrin repeat protein
MFKRGKAVGFAKPYKASAVLGSVVLALLVRGGAAGATPDSRLVEAARTQDHQAIRSLISQHADVNARSDDGSTALLWATHWNDTEVADLLLRAGADANTANAFQVTPLSQACLNGSGGLVRSLLKAGAKANAVIATGETPLMTCARSGSLEAVQMLIEYGAEINAKEPVQHQTALMWAAAEHHTAVVKALIAAHADLNAHSKEGLTALHFAARIGDQELARLLLAAGMDINILTQPEDKRAGTPVFLAGFGTFKTTGTKGYTPLLLATVRGQVDMALFLLDQGADPNAGGKFEEGGYLPLHWASTNWESYSANAVYGFDDPMAGISDRQAKFKLVKALLAHGAKVNERMTKPTPVFAGGYLDTVGATPFLLAASADDLDMMRLLLDAGADPKIPTATKANAIMAATGLNHFIGESLMTEAQAMETVKVLLQLGVEPKGETTVGENALFGPAYRGWNTVLAQMIDLGVNVNAVSKAGVTPYLAANGQGDRLGGVLYNKEGADLLLKHGANPNLGHPCEAQNKCGVSGE